MKPGERVALVRGEVRRLLAESAAFTRLPEATRSQLARDMTRVADAMSGAEDPAAAAGEVAEKLARVGKRAHAGKLGGAREPRGQDLRRAHGLVVKGGVRPVREVEFPAFVADLIKGTFAAVVDASVQQMEAYAALFSEAAGSLKDFVDDDPSAED